MIPGTWSVCSSSYGTVVAVPAESAAKNNLRARTTRRLINRPKPTKNGHQCPVSEKPKEKKRIGECYDTVSGIEWKKEKARRPSTITSKPYSYCSLRVQSSTDMVRVLCSRMLL